jgi:hypothetical protein
MSATLFSNVPADSFQHCDTLTNAVFCDSLASIIKQAQRKYPGEELVQRAWIRLQFRELAKTIGAFVDASFIADNDGKDI